MTYEKWNADLCLNEQDHIEADSHEDYKTWLSNLLNTKWFEYRPANPPKALILLSRVKSLLSTMEEHIKNPLEGDEIPPATVQLLRLLNGKPVDLAAIMSAVDPIVLDSAMSQLGYSIVTDNDDFDIEAEIAALESLEVIPKSAVA